MVNVGKGKDAAATSATSGIPGAERTAIGVRVLDVEDLLHWAIGLQRADLVDRAGVSAIGYGYDSLIGINRLMELGTTVDGGPGNSFTFYAGARQLAGDAVTVFETIRRLPGALQIVVLRHARSGTRPDVMADVPHFEPVMVWRKGRLVPKVRYDRSRNPVGYELVDRRPEIAAARALYGAWRRALVALKVSLAQPGVLEQHRVTGPAAPERPWETTPTASEAA